MKGYAGTSLSDLTTATGLSNGSIYGNFENKDEVALAAFDYNYRIIASEIMEKIASKQNATEKLRVYPAFFGNFFDNPKLYGGRPILNTAVEADDTHIRLRSKAVRAIEKWYSSLENIILQGVDKGEIKSDTNCDEFAGAFIALLEGGIMLAKVTGKSGGLYQPLSRLRK